MWERGLVLNENGSLEVEAALLPGLCRAREVNYKDLKSMTDKYAGVASETVSGNEMKSAEDLHQWISSNARKIPNSKASTSIDQLVQLSRMRKTLKPQFPRSRTTQAVSLFGRCLARCRLRTT